MIALEEIEKSSQPLLVVSSRKLSKDEIQNTFQFSPFSSWILDLADDAVTIAEVRQILKQVNFKPQFGKFYYLFFLQAELLSAEIANTLLKILEEPPEYLRIILFTSNERGLLPTIISRCRRQFLTDQGSQPADQLTDLDKVSKMSLAERFALAEELAKESAAEQIEKWLYQIRERGFPAQYRELFSRLVDSHQKLLNYNLNKRLLLENIFLNWPEK